MTVRHQHDGDGSQVHEDVETQRIRYKQLRVVEILGADRDYPDALDLGVVPGDVEQRFQTLDEDLRQHQQC